MPECEVKGVSNEFLIERWFNVLNYSPRIPSMKKIRFPHFIWVFLRKIHAAVNFRTEVFIHFIFNELRSNKFHDARIIHLVAEVCTLESHNFYVLLFNTVMEQAVMQQGTYLKLNFLSLRQFQVSKFIDSCLKRLWRTRLSSSGLFEVFAYSWEGQTSVFDISRTDVPHIAVTDISHCPVYTGHKLSCEFIFCSYYQI